MSIVALTRPETFDDLIGMDDTKTRIYYEIRGSILQGRNVPSYVIEGPPGTGKSTIAKIIAREMGGEVIELIGSDLSKADDIFDLAYQAKDGSVIYIEEAHSIHHNKVQPKLLEWLENFKIFTDSGPVVAPNVCFLFPTTNSGKLSSALRSRCKSITTKYYSTDNIAKIIRLACEKIGVFIEDEDALYMLAQSSRGTPRTAIINRLEPLTNIMLVDGLPFNKFTVEKFFDMYKIDYYGLEYRDKLYLSKMYEIMEQTGGSPVAKKTLEQSTGFESDIIEQVIERYLLQVGVITITSRGRILTKFGAEEILGRPMITPNSSRPSKIAHLTGNAYTTQLNEDSLREYLSTPDNRRKGIMGILKEFNLNYNKDAYKIKEMLSLLGYKSVQRAGIVFLDG